MNQTDLLIPPPQLEARLAAAPADLRGAIAQFAAKSIRDVPFLQTEAGRVRAWENAFTEARIQGRDAEEAGKTTHFAQPSDALKSEIDGLRVSEGGKGGLKQFQVHRRVAEIVITHLKERGTFYHDGSRGFVFHGEDKHLIAIDSDDLALELLLARYGLAPTEAIFRHVLDAMRLEALDLGTKTVVYVFSHYDAGTHTLYLSDLDRGIYRIRPQSIDHVDVGTDGVLFLHNPNRKPFRLLAPDATRSPLDELLSAPQGSRMACSGPRSSASFS